MRPKLMNKHLIFYSQAISQGNSSYTAKWMRQSHIFCNQDNIWHHIVSGILKICKKFAAFARKIVFVIVSEQFCNRKSTKNNFVSKYCKFLANLQKLWTNVISNDGSIKYRNNRSVSLRLSCTYFNLNRGNLVKSLGFLGLSNAIL